MTLLEAARQALPGIAWDEQTAHNGATWLLGDFGEGRYSVFGVGDIANAVANIVSIRDKFDSLLGETPRAVLAADLAALRERMRWRDVLVELPDDHEDVPVVARDSTGKLYPTFAYKLTGVDGDVRWFNNGYQLDNVTRWQPMPAAPEVQNG